MSGKAGLWSLYIIVGILILELLIFVGLSIYERSVKNRTLEISQRVGEVEFEVSQVEAEREEAVSFQERLFNLRTLLDTSVFWSPLFRNLEENTLNTVFFRTLQVSEFERKLNLSGIAPSYTDVAKLIRGLEEAPHVTEVSLISSGLTESDDAGFAFSLEIGFDAGLLEAEPEEK